MSTSRRRQMKTYHGHIVRLGIYSIRSQKEGVSSPVSLWDTIVSVPNFLSSVSLSSTTVFSDLIDEYVEWTWMTWTSWIRKYMVKVGYYLTTIRTDSNTDTPSFFCGQVLLSESDIPVDYRVPIHKVRDGSGSSFGLDKELSSYQKTLSLVYERDFRISEWDTKRVTTNDLWGML